MAKYILKVNKTRGFVTSGLTKSLGDEDAIFKSVIEPKVALKRFGTPDEVADVVVFLLSDQAKYMTGSVSFQARGCSVQHDEPFY